MDNPEITTNEPAPANQPGANPPNTIMVEGVLEIADSKNGSLIDPTRGGKARPSDPFVPRELIRRFKLKHGSMITASATPDPRFPNPKLRFIEKVDGMTIDERRHQPDFTQFTTITPNEMIKLESSKEQRMTTRVMDLFCPIGKGQRGLIVAPPRTGKTTLLRDIALGAIENHPELHVMMLLVDERPEEVTDMRRNVPAEVWASSNDEEIKSHIRISDLCIERAKRLVECGRDVLILLDSITRLARAHNNVRNTGRTGSGGLDVRALEKPRQLFAAARNTEEGGSLTIIASALIETGSRMDEVIFQEFKGTGNMEMVLDRKCADMRIFPAINIAASGTRREELLISEKRLEGIHFFRRAIVPQRIEEATETAVTRLSKTANNDEFLKLIAR
jgi:transcription termination factor Rho